MTNVWANERTVDQMFLFFSLEKKQYSLPFDQAPLYHGHCASQGEMEVFYIGTLLRVFFIPIFTFKKRYFVRMTCCGEVYELEPGLGKKVRRRKIQSLALEDLIDLNDYRQLGQRECPSCGYIVKSRDRFCSQCGSPL